MARNESDNAHPGPEPREPGRFAYEGLERLIHEKARLSILSSLASHPNGLVFGDLKALCALTDGNLSRQITQLQEAGLVEVFKGHKGNRPQTLVRLSREGRKRFVEYIEVLEGVLADAASAARRPTPSARPGLAAR
jgi:DNA-binding MarR family transcriptional regulator